MPVTNPVTGLTAVARYSQIDVSWDAQPDAPSYWVRAKIAGRQVKWETVCGGTNNFITLRNMDQGTVYTITCWAGLDGPGNNTSVVVVTKGALPVTPMATVTTTVPCPDVPPEPGPPTAITNPATSVTQTAAVLHGVVNPDLLDTHAHFDYGLTTAYDSSTADDASPGSGGVSVPVSAALTGLVAGTTYHFRVAAANLAGDVKGADAAFTTAPVVESGVDFALNPSAHGYPDATNTGAILGPLTALQRGVGASGPGWNYNGDTLTISGSDITVANLDVPGQIMVQGTNVTVRNCRVIGNAFNGNGITVGGVGYLIDHCTVQGVNDTSGGFDAGIKGYRGNTVRGVIDACHIFNCRSGTQDTAGTLRNTYIHQMRHASGDHINGMTQNGGMDGLIIEHNTIFNAYSQTDAVGLFSDFGVEGNDTVRDNILAGGGYTIYGGAGGPNSSDPLNVKILNNRISNKYYAQGGFWGWIAYQGSAGRGNVTSGNIWDHTGQRIAGQ